MRRIQIYQWDHWFFLSFHNNSSDYLLKVYNWNEQQQSTILSSFFWGYCFSQILASEIAQRYGPKILLLIASIVCSVLTLIMPYSASIGMNWFICCRVLQGFSQGVFYPCTHMMLGRWIHPSERGILTTFAYAGTQFGTIVTMIVSGWLASTSAGWPSIFYVSGGAMLLWSLVWTFLGCNAPSQSKFISENERKFIESADGSSQSKNSQRVPWRDILASVPVWALVITHSGQCWAYWTLLTQTPKFLRDVFQFNIKEVIYSWSFDWWDF